MNDKIVDGAFALGFVAIAIFAVFAHRGLAPATGVMALAVALRGDIWRRGFALLRPSRVISEPLPLAFAAALAFSIWVALTAFWSPTPGAGWLGLTILSAPLAAGALVHGALTASPRRAARYGRWLVLSVATVSALLMFEGLSGAYLREISPPTDLSPLRWKDFTALGRGLTGMSPLVFPLAVILRRISGSWLVAFSPAFALLIAAPHFSIFANVVALLAGAAVFIAAMARPRFILNFMVGIFLAGLIATPFLARMIPIGELLSGDAAFLPPSWAQRLIIWKEAGDLALRACLPLGCGADYARALTAGAATVSIPNWPVPVAVMATHPHNVFLQIWLELGLPGVALFALALAASAAALLKAPLKRDVAAAICAVLAVSFVSVIFEASIWQVWRLAVFALAAFSCALASRR